MPRHGGHNRGRGRGVLWLKSHLTHADDSCLIWPWSGNHQGYGQVGYNGKVHKAHRLMCEFVHGPAPSPDFDAAHSCGNGHMGCVSPRHLSWKTSRQNRLDACAHGTDRKKRKRLAPEIVLQIKESPKSYLEIADEFGVYFGTVGKIKRGELYPSIGRPALSEFTDEEIAAEYNRRQIAKAS